MKSNDWEGVEVGAEVINLGELNDFLNANPGTTFQSAQRIIEEKALRLWDGLNRPGYLSLFTVNLSGKTVFVTHPKNFFNPNELQFTLQLQVEIRQ